MTATATEAGFAPAPDHLDELDIEHADWVLAEEFRLVALEPWTFTRPCRCGDHWEFERAWCTRCGHPLNQAEGH